MANLIWKSALYANSPRTLRCLWDRIDNSNLARRLVTGVFWSVAGAIVARGVMFAASIVIARFLGKHNFGQWGIVRSTTDMIAVLSGAGLAQTATKHVADHRVSDPARTGKIIALLLGATATVGTVAAALLFFSSAFLAEHVLQTPELGFVMQVAGFLLLVQLLTRVQCGILAGFESFKAIARYNLISGLLLFPLTVGGTYFYGLVGTAAGMTIAFAIQAILIQRAIWRQAKRERILIDPWYCRSELNVLWQFSLPVLLAGAVVTPTQWLTRTLLVNQPGGYSELGSFTAALAFQMLLLFVGTTLNGPLIALLANSAQQQQEKLEHINILSSWLLGAFSALPLLCFPEIHAFMFGASYQDPQFHVTFALVVFATVIVLFKQGIARTLLTRDLVWWGFVSNLAWAAVMLAASSLLLHWGAMGLATASLIAYAVTTFAFFPLYTRQRLVPRATLWSHEAAGIWFALIVALAMAIYPVDPATRTIICLLLFFTLCGLSKRLTRVITA